MNLIINGEDRTFDEGTTVQAILQALKIEDKVMAAAVNMEIVEKDDWATFVPKDGDKLELLHFVGGG
jgi:sulfur carrier protein